MSVALVAIAACGRLQFDPVGSGMPDANVRDDATDSGIDAARACLTNDAYKPAAGLTNRYREGVPTVSWAAARADCMADGADLWVVDSALEANAWTGDWMGITDAATEGTWLTVDGTPATYLPWEAGQPDGGSTEDCGRTSGAGFEDRDCMDLRDYVCECKVN